MALPLIAAIWLVYAYSEPIARFISQNPIAGSVLYLLLNVIDAVIAPGATLPLIPVAAEVWGHIWTAILTTAGWTLGSLIAFSIARHWGRPVVQKLVSMERLERMKRYVPKRLFMSVVLLRLMVPMDVISYAVGLFTHMDTASYVLATLIGVAPSAVILAHLGKLPRAYELFTVGIVLVAGVGFFLSMRRSHRRRPRQVHPRPSR